MNPPSLKLRGTSSATRALVVLSTALAAFAEGALATPYFPPQTIWFAAAAALLLALVGERVRPVVLPILLASMYLLPAIMIVAIANENFSIEYVFLLPLLGLCLSGRGAAQWSLPQPWRWPLITWGIIVSVSWPMVFMREADFRWWVLWSSSAANMSKGISPGEVNQHVSYLAVVHNLGILWIDALCRWYRSNPDRFRREVLYPLAVTATAGSLVAIYQGFVDLSFVNRGFWTYMLRAAGTHGDPNKLGAIAALWAVSGAVLARRFAPPWSTIAAVASVAIGVAAVWTSGSRTGLGAIGVSVVVAGFEVARALRHSGVGLKQMARPAAGLALVAIALVVVLRGASTHTVVQRGVLHYLPIVGDHSLAHTANEWLWERFGYGPAAIEMIKSHPIEGVGVGLFHTLVHDFGRLRGYDLTPDNAQNWWRHMIAELGLIGVIPALWWCVVLLTLLFTRAPSGDRVSIGMLRGVLIGFGVASTFGMPSQSAAVAITVWALVFWLLAERGGDAPAPRIPAVLARHGAIIAGALIAVHFAATVVDARGELRPRHRAERFDWYYDYGFGELEPDPGGNPVQRRWTLHEAVAVIPVKGQVLKLVAWIDHPDGDTNPPHVTVRADGRTVFDGRLTRSSPLFADVPATPGKTHMVIETTIDRLYRPSEAGSRDRRALGLSIRDWVWE
jgi:hypothetical protein